MTSTPFCDPAPSPLSSPNATQPADTHEWSRSRFWLSHFLHNRHDRPKLNWQAIPQFDQRPIASPTTSNGSSAASMPSLGALSGILRRFNFHEPNFPRLIALAQHRHADDPAFVQSLRLLSRERVYHRQVLSQYLHASFPSTQATPCRLPPRQSLTPLLGIRYFLASLLLENLLDVSLLKLSANQWNEPVFATLCQTILRDKTAHIQFLAERLTLEYADFNFARRNLRRLRLRTLFMAHLRHTTNQHRSLLSQTGTTPAKFAHQNWPPFERIIQCIVPYRRDQLLASLALQRNQPYGQSSCQQAF